MWWRTLSPIIRYTVILAGWAYWVWTIQHSPLLEEISDSTKTILTYAPPTLTGILWLVLKLHQVLGFLFFPQTLQRYFERRRDLNDEDSRVLEDAALAIHYGREEKALNGLEELVHRGTGPAVKLARALRTWAGAQQVWRHRRALGIGYENHPQLHALFFTHNEDRINLRHHALAQELSSVSARELDELAVRYMELTDFLIEQWNDPASPFRNAAGTSLEQLTGKQYLAGGPRRIKLWWENFRPGFRQGGGPLHVGIRLLRMHSFADAMNLLERLGRDGLLARPSETLRRCATMLSYLKRAGGHPTLEELPSFFYDLHMVCENLSFLRFPLVVFEQSEIVTWCRRSRELREAKVEFVDAVFLLWEHFGDDLSPWMAYLLNRILNVKRRRLPLRINFWRKEWKARRENFEVYVEHLMDGVAAASDRKFARAERAFDQAARLEPLNCTPLVNMVYLRIVSGRETQARELAGEIVHRFPNDPAAFLALGKLFAALLDDCSEAQRLYVRARELNPDATEPLIMLGELKLLEGQYSESQRFFDLTLQMDPNALDAKLGLARLYLETRRFDRAIENLLAMAREGRGEYNNLAHYHLYRTYREMNDAGHAVEFLDKVPHTFFKEPDELDDIACHLESEKLFAKARIYSERAMLLRVKGRGKDGGTETARNG